VSLLAIWLTITHALKLTHAKGEKGQCGEFSSSLDDIICVLAKRVTNFGLQSTRERQPLPKGGLYEYFLLETVL